MENLSDEETISNAVTAADPRRIEPDGIAWKNPATGASGQISGVVEYHDKNLLCRRFSTSRARFDGVSLVHGDVCLGDGGGWQLRAFAPS